MKSEQLRDYYRVEYDAIEEELRPEIFARRQRGQKPAKDARRATKDREDSDKLELDRQYRALWERFQGSA